MCNPSWSASSTAQRAMDGADALVLLRLLRACRRPGDLRCVVRLAATCKALWSTFRAHRRDLLSLCVPVALAPRIEACSHPAVLHAGAFGPERVALLLETGHLVVADLRAVELTRPPAGRDDITAEAKGPRHKRRDAAKVRRGHGRGGGGTAARGDVGRGDAAEKNAVRGDVSGHVLGYSPDGAWLADGGVWPHIPFVRLWHLASGTSPMLLKGHSARCFGVSFSPRGRYLATGAYDRTVVVWDLMAPAQGMLPRERHRLMGKMVAMPTRDDHNSVVMTRAREDVLFTCLAWGPDGSILATGTGHGEVMLWEPEQGHVQMRLAGGARGAGFNSGQFSNRPGTDVYVPLAMWTSVVQCLAWSPDGSKLCAAMASGGLVIWGPDGRVLHVTHAAGAEAQNVVSLCWSPGGDAVAVAHMDRVCVHSLKDEGAAFRRPVHAELQGRGVVGLTWAPSMRLVVFAVDEAHTLVVDALELDPLST